MRDGIFILMDDDSMQIGLLLDDEVVQRWVIEAVDHLLENRPVEVRCIVINSSTQSRKTYWVGGLAANPAWNVFMMCRWMGRKLSRKGGIEIRRPQPIWDIINKSEVNIEYCEPIDDGGWNKLPSEVVATISGMDLVLRFGFGLLKGEALFAPKHGILSYHHGDLTKFRGPPAGFWEFMFEEDEAGITIQQLNESIDSGKIANLKSVDISCLDTWQAVERELFFHSTEMLPEAIDTVAAGQLERPETLGEYRTFPKWNTILRYLVKNHS